MYDVICLGRLVIYKVLKWKKKCVYILMFCFLNCNFNLRYEGFLNKLL